MRWLGGALALGIGCLGACAAQRPTDLAATNVAVHDVVETHEQTYRVGDLAARHAFTVLVFFSATCPTVAAHDARLISLWRKYRDRDVGFYVVASESNVTSKQLTHEATKRGYPFPLLQDPEGRLARRLNVRYASQAFVLERDGNVAFAGSIDSDRRFLHRDAKPFLRNALDALLSGSAAPSADTAAFGCALSL